MFTWKFLTATQQFILLIYIICFLSGGLSHWQDILHGGLFPYVGIPFIFNLFLTSLAILDLLAIVLLAIKPTIGLMLSIVIMIIDLSVDFFAGYQYWNINLFNNVRLKLLLIFGVFVFVTAPILIVQIHRAKLSRVNLA